MIVVPLKEGENIEKALKKFKRKFETDNACNLRTAVAADRRIKICQSACFFEFYFLYSLHKN